MKVPDVYSRFQPTLDFIDKFSQKFAISNLMGVCPVGAELMHEDGRTDTMKLVSARREYGDATKTATDVDK